jgi:tetratricopeptide (TPR) repeat protein
VSWIRLRATVAGFLLAIGSVALFAEEPASAMSQAQARELFREAERLRSQEDYPRAAEVYRDLLAHAPADAEREVAIQRLYDIANYWLDDTREQMRQLRDIDWLSWGFWLENWLPPLQLDVKWWVGRWHLLHFDRTKPLFDEEGRAVEMLHCVSASDPDGPLADKALFLMGAVALFREDYERVDEHCSKLVDRNGESPLAAQALELAIVAKQMSLDGTREEGRKLTELRRLLDKAFRGYPQLTNDPEKRRFLVQQLANVDEREAERAFQAAEELRKAGNLQDARRAYKVILSIYPKTESATRAHERLDELKGQSGER